jgi:hypothetical protein
MAGMGGVTGGMGGEPEPSYPEFEPETRPMSERGNPDGVEADTSYPGLIEFDSSGKLNNNFFVRKGMPIVDASGLRVDAKRAAVLVYDTEPDDSPTDYFSSFTATIRFESEKAPGVWLGFAGDAKRNDGYQVSYYINKGSNGGPEFIDVDSVHFCNECWVGTIVKEGDSGETMSSCEVGNLCSFRPGEAYGWTYLSPELATTGIRITVRSPSALFLDVMVELLDSNDSALDFQTFRYSLVRRTIGEVLFGFRAGDAPLTVKSVEISEPLEIKTREIVTAEGTGLNMWLPSAVREGADIEGVLTVSPSLQAGEGSRLFFHYLRRFASAHNWALVDVGRGVTPETLRAGIVKLADAAMHDELKTAPVFVNSLLSALPHESHLDEVLVGRMIGFFADKVQSRTDIMDDIVPLAPSTEQGREVPGFYSYSQKSLIANRGVVSRPYDEGRTKGALWGIVNHSDQTHAIVDSFVFYLPFLQELISLRMADGNLVDLNPENGYLATNETIMMGDTFAPTVKTWSEASEAERKDKAFSFLPGPESAAVYQAFHYFRLLRDANGRPIVRDGNLVMEPKKVRWLAAPPHGQPGESRDLTLQLDSDVEWEKVEILEVHDGVHLRKEVSPVPGETIEASFSNLGPGIHTFIGKAWTKEGVLHVTHPVAAIMGSDG